MAIAIYMDAHIPRAITSGLLLDGVDVITAQEDNASDMPDPALLDHATTLHRVLFTFDDDLLTEATRRQRVGISFAGVIYVHPLNVSIARCIHDIGILAKAAELEDLTNRVEFLPL